LQAEELREAARAEVKELDVVGRVARHEVGLLRVRVRARVMARVRARVRVRP